MILKIVINSILIIGLSLAQISFISGLPIPISYLNLILVALIFILGFADLNLAIWWALGTGFMLEIFSFLPFGIYLMSLCLTVIIANLLLNYFFTNRSLYSFVVLAALATISYKSIFNFSIFMSSFGDKYTVAGGANFWVSILWQIVLNSLVTFIVFYILHFLGRNFRPVFLHKKY
jgi:hypothetical protein